MPFGLIYIYFIGFIGLSIWWWWQATVQCETGGIEGMRGENSSLSEHCASNRAHDGSAADEASRSEELV